MKKDRTELQDLTYPCSVSNVQRSDSFRNIFFLTVYQEVENRIEAFREMLTKKLLTLPSSLEEQKRLIRYLVHLEATGDPAWECLTNMQRWLIQLLNVCKDENIKKGKTFYTF